VPAERVNTTQGAGWGARVTAASRLSFTLIDLNGESGRRNGMASLSLREPSLRVLVRPAAAFGLETDEASAGHADAIAAFVRELQQRWSAPPVHVTVEQGLPAHSGLGSKTTTLLAIGKAAALVWGRSADTDELVQVSRRGGTSGASVNLIDRGGFLVDGGHANPPDFAADPGKYLRPSRYAAGGKRAPVLINLPFPPWPILLILGVGTKLHGEEELAWSRRTLPIPAREAHRTAHLVLMNLAPAIAEADYEGFCRALNRLTFETYFKQQQIATQAPALRGMLAEARDRPEIDAIGMSVSGPLCFAFTRRPAAATAWLEGLRGAGVVQDYFFTNAQNHPAVIESVPLGAEWSGP
jgi:beta-ribofuranosylaminobenzene 5'-phosphate synthase